MELIVYPGEAGARPKVRADGRSVGEAVRREEISSSYISESESEDDGNGPLWLYCRDLQKRALLVWLEELEETTDDVTVIPPVYVVRYPDLLEMGWGWQRLAIYHPGGYVDWNIFKGYLKEYFSKNTGEVAALCANKKPDKDKDYFIRNAAEVAALSAKKRPHKGYFSHYAGEAATLCCDYNTLYAAYLCIEVENYFHWGYFKLLVAEDISLSNEIEERANQLIQSADEFPAAGAGLVCIVKETELLLDLLVCDFELSDRDYDTIKMMITFSKKVRHAAFNLMLCKGPESSAAAGAMLGMAKEAKFVRSLLSQVDCFVCPDYFFCGMIRETTLRVLNTLLEDFACETPDNGDVDGIPASAKSENPLSTVGDLNCEESDSVEHSKEDADEYCEVDNKTKFCVTINKDEELEGKPMETSELWK